MCTCAVLSDRLTRGSSRLAGARFLSQISTHNLLTLTRIRLCLEISNGAAALARREQGWRSSWHRAA